MQSLILKQFLLAATLGIVQVSSSPSQVSESATIEILVTPITTIPENGKIKVTIPPSTSITQGTVACSMVMIMIILNFISLF